MTKGIRFKHDYLTEVVFRINFSNILKLSGNNKDAAEDFRKSIFKEFPNVHFRFNNNINVTIDIQSGKSQSLMEEGDLTWIFSTEDNKKQIHLNAKSLILHYKKGAYEGFSEFLKDVIKLLDSLSYYMPYNFNFLELRYINQIDDEDICEENIKDFINPSLTDNIIFDLEDGENFSQTVTRLDLIKEDYNLTFQYGFFNPRFPDYTFKKDFILDLDCKKIDMDSVNSNDDIVCELKKMNKFIYKKFKYSTTKKLRDRMELIE
ncbi:MAG: TIGR04255 family protein [Methanobrevibacter ruminantium]|uniref:TIGR04255 family protein n=1 Tax=Methanobrevibacter ruminantium TaxID=83816 RepID=UPI0026F1F369|nr:TIGR04255 family protein [Methanobrevibacter ruminantium]MDO5841709.1 TIGR04255 family protein [Methanobrevibacter ruminantium]